jgi:hypothetical protein
MSLTDADIGRIAQRVVELLREESPARQADTSVSVSAEPEWISAGEYAEKFNVSLATVYRNADSLGAVRIGNGPKATLRLPAQTVEVSAAEDNGAARPDPKAKPNPPETKPRRRKSRGNVRLLEVRGPSPYAAPANESAPGGADTPAEGLTKGGCSSNG